MGEDKMNKQIFRHVHVHFEFKDRAEDIAVRTLEPVEEVIKQIQNPNNWENGVVPIISKVWVEHW